MRLANFIGGEFVAPASGAYIDDIGPATGEVIARIRAVPVWAPSLSRVCSVDAEPSNAARHHAPRPMVKVAVPDLATVALKDPKDFTIIGQANEAPMVIYVKADSPYKTLKDLVDDAQKQIASQQPTTSTGTGTRPWANRPATSRPASPRPPGRSPRSSSGRTHGRQDRRRRRSGPAYP